jgi:TIR domain/Ankyrin repeats (3 copies)
MSSKVFISYRREDSAAYAGRIQDWLKREFGHEFIFIDVDGIPLGIDFVKHLRREVSSCGALLAVIGPHWLDVRDENGARRLDSPTDFVRIEIATALRRTIPVVPILLDGTRVPKADQLPKDLKELAVRNGLDVRHTTFPTDMDKLIRWLKEQIGTPLASQPPPRMQERPTATLKAESKYLAKTESEYLEELLKVDDSGNHSRLVEAIASGISPDLADEIGRTLLMHAALHGADKAALFLIKAGANVDLQDSRGQIAIILAACALSGMSPDSAFVNRNAGGIYYAIIRPDSYDRVVNLLIAKGADLEVVDKKNETALTLVAARGYVIPIKMLLENGANVHHRNNHLMTPLICAARCDNFEAANLLLQFGSAPNASDSVGATALLYAAFNGNEKLYRLLVDGGADEQHKDNAGRGVGEVRKIGERQRQERAAEDPNVKSR